MAAIVKGHRRILFISIRYGNRIQQDAVMLDDIDSEIIAAHFDIFGSLT
jgi:hypothetical protein